jgi:hypothetical protein
MALFKLDADSIRLWRNRRANDPNKLNYYNCKNIMKASKTSKQWMREHVNDPYVQRAQKDGYRSRAAYKLLEIDEHDHLIKPGMVVVDLGGDSRRVVSGGGK